jgi:CheY-like chemotaxis protein
MAYTAEPGQDRNVLRVVLIDTRPDRRLLVRHLFESTGLVATDIGEAANTADAVELLDREDRDLVVVEIQMPVSQGLETIAALRSHSPGLPIVVCSFHCDPATKELALAQGADVYLDKPVGSLYLKAVLRRFLPEPSSEAEAPPPELSLSAPLALKPARRQTGERGSAVPGPDPLVGPSAEPSDPSA